MARGDRETKRRLYWPGVILRLLILVAVGVAILVIGQEKYGWRPFGHKITAQELREISHGNMPTPPPESMDDLLRGAVKDEVELDEEVPPPTPEATPEPAPTTTTVKTTTTTTTTTKPKSGLTKKDQDDLDALLKQEIK